MMSSPSRPQDNQASAVPEWVAVSRWPTGAAVKADPNGRLDPLAQWLAQKPQEEPWNAIGSVALQHHVQTKGACKEAAHSPWSVNATKGSEIPEKDVGK
ncbi:hypothetical protein ACJZ2D_014103 [Fusarium nematophilum]